MNSYNTVIEEIKSRCNIVDIISPLVQLKRAGSNYKGCCPFHNEKTPSFIVSETKQIFTCFGCGARGDAIEFVKRFYNISFGEAVERLAKQYGVELDKTDDPQLKKKESCYEANRLAARYFFKGIQKNNNPGLKYLLGRGLTLDTIKRFGLGYADSDWRSLSSYMKTVGYNSDLLTELGLVRIKNNSTYDYFRDRVIFPIINTKGKVIGFGGRIMDQGEPKYLNSPESVVFQKKFNLFGLNLARKEIQKEGYAIVVEGYMDVISLSQAGIENVVASCGTALTPEQATLLKRYCDKVVLCYDADAAGIGAAVRGIDILRNAQLDVRVLHVTDGKDPDEFIKKHGKDEFLRLIKEKSVPDIEYKLRLAKKKYDLKDTAESVKFLKEAANIIKPLAPVEAEIYIKRICEEFRISEQAMRDQISGAYGKDSPVTADASGNAQKTPVSVSKSELMMEKTLFRLSMLKSEYFAVFKEYPEAIVTDEGCKVYDALEESFSPDADFDAAAVRDRLDDDVFKYFDSIFKDVKIGENDKALYDDCVSVLMKKRLSQREKEILDTISIADSDVDTDVLNGLLKELSEIQRKIRG